MQRWFNFINRNYEVGDKVKVLVTYDTGEEKYYFGYIVKYNVADTQNRYCVSIEGIGDVWTGDTVELF